MASIEVSEKAAEWLEKAEGEIQERILKKLNDVAGFPEHYLKRLRGSPYYRLRVGDYRVIIDWKKDEDTLLVRRIDKRDRVYD